MAAASFEGKRCVVFGGAGFLGSHTAAELVARGAHVVCFDRVAPPEALSGLAEAVVGDILDPPAIARAVTGADHVFAFAGGIGAGPSLADPVADLECGPRAQLLLLDTLVRVAPAASVVLPGSRLEYGVPRYLPVDEAHPLAGDSPYAIHRSTCAAYYRLYHAQHGLHAVVLRLSNPYGPRIGGGSLGLGVLNRFIAMALAGETIPLFGGGEQLRDFVHVSDVVAAFLSAAVTPDAAGRALNIGSGEPVSLRGAAELAVSAAGSGAIDASVPWPPGLELTETGDFHFDISAACDILSWRPAVPTARGIAETVSALTGR